ncbi:uncharacterized protein LOC110287286 [Mus caroli]|uniref:Uncharacterized protein LOC110287286 n=1 Tax=Mus caroli TaxID=10089 RepID=A0A6P5P643_MUSCR|nr:uncharacterized protein LOC110287286 [Mus caroli]
MENGKDKSEEQRRAQVSGYLKNDLEDSNCYCDSFHSCLYYSKHFNNNISMNKGQTSEKKHIQIQNINHAGDSKNVLHCQLLKEHIPVDHIPASGSEEYHSYLDQYDGGSSSYILQSNRNKYQGRSAANILPDVQDNFYHYIGHVSNSQPRVLYGIGKGGVVLRQGSALTHYKPNVFVNPLSPEAPPLPSDWLIQLISSKRPSAHGIVSSRRLRGTSSLLVLERTTTLPPASSKSNPNIDLTMPPEVEFTATSESLEYCELQKQHALNLQGLDQEIPLLEHPSVIPLRNQSWNSIVDLIDSSLVLNTQSRKSSFPKSPRSPSKSNSGHGSLSQNPVANTSRISTTQSPRSYRVPYYSSVPPSQSPKPQITLNPLPEHSVSHLIKLIEAQSKLPMTLSKRLLHPPQAKRSSFTSSEVSTLQSSLSSMKSSVSGQRALTIRQYTIESAYASIMQNPSSLPIMTKPRNELMEEIRKGIKLRKTRPRAENEETENGAEMIRVRRKAMGYHSEKSDSETEWIE